MSTPPTLTVLQGGRTGSRPFDGVQGVEIIAHDRHCATQLLDRATPHFPAEIIPGTDWIVRFHPPTTTINWVTDLLVLIEYWLQSMPLPCANLRDGDHHHLIRAPTASTPKTPTPWEAA